jgi:hypothetical protein
MPPSSIETGEIPAWEAWVPTLAWATHTPTGITTVARWTRIASQVFFFVDIIATDSKATTGLTITLPVAPRNSGVNISCASFERAGAGGVTYSNPGAYIKADGADNKINFNLLTTGTDGQAIEASVAGVYEV